jgi:hypothetical protein
LTTDIRALFSGHVFERCGLRAGPGEQIVDLTVEMTADDLCDFVGKVCLRIDAAELAGFHDRSDDRPMLAAFVRRNPIMPGVWDRR